MDDKLAQAYTGKSASQGGLNVPELFSLATSRGYTGNKKREDLLDFLRNHPSSDKTLQTVESASISHSRLLSDHLQYVIDTQAGKNFSLMAGCFCPPHKGHYKTFKDSILNFNLDVLIIQSFNHVKPKNTRHGTPLEHTIRVLEMYARQLMAEIEGVEVYVVPIDGTKLTTMWWMTPEINKYYDINYIDDPSSTSFNKEPRKLADFGKAFYPQLRQYEDKYVEIRILRENDGLSATKFTQCLENYQAKPTPENRAKCYMFIDHLLPSDMEAYLDDIMQYQIYATPK